MDYEELGREFATNMHGFKRFFLKNFNDNQRGEVFALMIIAKAENGISPSDIGTKIEVSSPRVCAILNTLEGKELITREIDKNNRRNVIVKATELGKVHSEEHYNKAMKIYAKVLEKLGEHDALELIRITQKICEIDEL